MRRKCYVKKSRVIHSHLPNIVNCIKYKCCSLIKGINLKKIMNEKVDYNMNTHDYDALDN